jgi:hypothetical protein
MSSLHRQFKDILQREGTEEALRSDLKTVWENHSSKRNLTINVAFCRQRPTAPLMLMPPGAAVDPVDGAPLPAWSTPDAYFVSLPNLPAPECIPIQKPRNAQLKRCSAINTTTSAVNAAASASGGQVYTAEPPDELRDMYIPEAVPFRFQSYCQSP